MYERGCGSVCLYLRTCQGCSQSRAIVNAPIQLPNIVQATTIVEVDDILNMEAKINYM